MASDNLNLDQLTGAENEKTNLINDIFQQLEDAVTEQLSVAVLGVTLVLTSDQCYRYMVYEFTGTPGANRDVEVLTGKKLYLCENAVTDGSVLTVKTNAGTGIALAQGVKKILYCDGTNVIEVGAAAQLMQTFAFGTITAFNGTKFLETPGRVLGSAAVGYEATRAGSVVGLGVNLEVITESTPGTFDIEVYVGGAAVYSVQITTSGLGVYTQTGTQGVGIDAIAASDSIAVRVAFGTFVGYIDNVVVYVEVATNL